MCFKIFTLFTKISLYHTITLNLYFYYPHNPKKTFYVRFKHISHSFYKVFSILQKNFEMVRSSLYELGIPHEMLVVNDFCDVIINARVCKMIVASLFNTLFEARLEHRFAYFKMNPK